VGVGGHQAVDPAECPLPDDLRRRRVDQGLDDRDRNPGSGCGQSHPIEVATPESGQPVTVDPEGQPVEITVEIRVEILGGVGAGEGVHGFTVRSMEVEH
jgi:hypothetical protein